MPSERYKRLKAMGVCVLCGQRAARLGKTTCKPCAVYASAATSQYYWDNRETVLDRARQKAAERKRLGFCVICGKRDALQGKSMCQRCIDDQAFKYNHRPAATKAREKAAARAKYEERKAAGICTQCGTRAAAAGYVKCETCRGMDKARKAQREAQGMCTRCGVRPATAGIKLCAQCREENRRWEKSPEGRAARHEFLAALYQKARSAGICVTCRKRPAVDGRASCAECRDARHARAAKKAQVRRESGMCSRCGKHQPAEGAKMCPKCQAESREQHRRQRDAKKHLPGV